MPRHPNKPPPVHRISKRPKREKTHPKNLHPKFPNPIRPSDDQKENHPKNLPIRLYPLDPFILFNPFKNPQNRTTPLKQIKPPKNPTIILHLRKIKRRPITHRQPPPTTFLLPLDLFL